MDVDLRASLAGFAGALVVLVLLFWLVGIQRILDALSQADPALTGVVLAVAAGWLTAWGLSLWTVLGVLGSPVSPVRSVAVFAASMFANNVTPFGQAGGEPVSALFISRATDSEYESGLAAIASVDSLNFIPSIGLAALGIAYFSTQIAFGRRLRVATFAVGTLAVGVPVLAYVAWRYRERVEKTAVRALMPVFRGFGRVLPRRTPPTSEAVHVRVRGFTRAVGRVATDRRSLAMALGFSFAGWFCLATSLWVSLSAVGVTVPFAVTLVAVPVGAIAGVTPLPGGLGGVEAVLVGLLVALGVGPTVATAAVMLHRAATYWLPMLVGGVVAGTLGTR